DKVQGACWGLVVKVVGSGESGENTREEGFTGLAGKWCTVYSVCTVFLKREGDRGGEEILESKMEREKGNSVKEKQSTLVDDSTKGNIHVDEATTSKVATHSSSNTVEAKQVFLTWQRNMIIMCSLF
nr:hypothetical protein [Tanacetum cinerariifolium]